MSLQAKNNETLNVHDILDDHVLVDGFPLVFDLTSSQGAWIVDARSGERYLDLFSFFASLPLGFRHPVFDRPEVRESLARTVVHKVSNSDAYTEDYARFVQTFADLASPGFRHLFFVEGGSLAVENALKTAFDWKARKNLRAGRMAKDGSSLGTRVLHFREAFHGRSGYTLSLTNTDPVKTDYFPKFDWPRVDNPKVCFPLDDRERERVAAAEAASLAQIEMAFQRHPHDIAAVIIEPVQGEGGDNHFRGEFLRALREVADREDAMLIFDEVQTGFGLTGKLWAYEHFDVVPDIVCFGKKTQVCGIMVGERVDEIEDNVFTVSSRINSTWGGNLADMVRCEAILKTIHGECLVDNAARLGKVLLRGLRDVAKAHTELVSNVRGIGLMCAFDFPDSATRGEFLKRVLEEKVLLLACGDRSVRFRPALTIAEADIEIALDRIVRVLEGLPA